MQGLNQGTMELESKLPKAWVVLELMKFLIMGDFPTNLKTYGPPIIAGVSWQTKYFQRIM
jgi:hypothetical protein